MLAAIRRRHPSLCPAEFGSLRAKLQDDQPLHERSAGVPASTASGVLAGEGALPRHELQERHGALQLRAAFVGAPGVQVPHHAGGLAERRRRGPGPLEGRQARGRVAGLLTGRGLLRLVGYVLGEEPTLHGVERPRHPQVGRVERPHAAARLRVSKFQRQARDELWHRPPGRPQHPAGLDQYRPHSAERLHRDGSEVKLAEKRAQRDGFEVGGLGVQAKSGGDDG
mmetsp:Transcript_24010/g.67412  ORF Transcript_24010/g.67412 Transcript_24010/m.67412 type:complete len:225 (+) Transcript_24010:107-781(+)